MSNASQALIMAAGILLGVLILALIVTLFASSNSLSTKYDEAKQLEAVQRYNAAFSKYLSRELTIHEIETIYNLAMDKGIEVDYMKGNVKQKESPSKEDIVGLYTASVPDYNVPKYKIKVEFDNKGYIIRVIIEDA